MVSLDFRGKLNFSRLALEAVIPIDFSRVQNGISAGRVNESRSIEGVRLHFTEINVSDKGTILRLSHIVLNQYLVLENTQLNLVVL